MSESGICANARDDLPYHPVSLLRPSPAFRHADWCLSDVSAPLCECRRVPRPCPPAERMAEVFVLAEYRR